MANLDPSKVAYIAVHCSASPPSVYVDAKVIDRWHRNNGFFKIGYHFVIKRDGTVEKGRELHEVGAHVAGFNSSSIGICLVGGVDEKGNPANNFTEDQLRSLITTARGMKMFINSKAHIQGHRDFPKVAKACPSFDVREWLKEAAPELL